MSNLLSSIAQSLVNVIHSGRAGSTDQGTQTVGHKSTSFYGKSASEITRELAARGDGSMARGVTKISQKSYWQGRTHGKR